MAQAIPAMVQVEAMEAQTTAVRVAATEVPTTEAPTRTTEIQTTETQTTAEATTLGARRKYGRLPPPLPGTRILLHPTAQVTPTGAETTTTIVSNVSY